jgi:hypothetical protein
MGDISSRLAPEAKRLYLRTKGNEMVSSLVQVAPSIDAAAFRRDVERSGGSIRSWLSETNLVSVEIDATRLSDLADLPGVVYVETGQPYRP